MRVILVGAGLSSALISVLLRRQYGSKIKLVVYDKDQNIGGRMTTRYDSEEKPVCSVDMGAQYLAVSESNRVTMEFFQQLVDHRVIELLDKQNTIGIPPTPLIDYTVPNGIVLVVKYYFEQADVEMHLSKKITKIDLDSSTGKYQMCTDEGQLDESEVVIVTIPVPQMLGRLHGTIAQLIDENKEVKDKLATVKFYSRFAVALFYPPSVRSLNVPWRIFCSYEKDHEFLRFLSVDNAKRNQSEQAFSLLVHTSVEFGAEHCKEDINVVGERIQNEVFRFVPDLPRNPSSVQYHRWDQCQVDEPYPGAPGYLVLKDDPPLILAGDSFASESTIQACIEAAVATVKQIQTLLP